MHLQCSLDYRRHITVQNIQPEGNKSEMLMQTIKFYDTVDIKRIEVIS